MTLSYRQRIFNSMMVMVVALLMVLAALLLPTIERQVQVMDSLFVIDITDSMNVEDAILDGEPVARLFWAKKMIKRALLEMPCGSRAGLAIFSESRSLLLLNPVDVCQSYNDLVQMLNLISTHMAWVRSSEISKATYTAIKQAKKIDPQPTIVFLTDGHESPPVHESLFPKFSGKPGEVHGLLVGIGGEDLLPIPKTNEKGEISGFWAVNDVMHKSVYASLRANTSNSVSEKRTEHLSSQKRAHLQTLADRVGFTFVSSPESPAGLVKAIRAEAVTHDQLVDYDLYPWLAGIALLLLALVYFPYGIFSKQK